MKAEDFVKQTEENRMPFQSDPIIGFLNEIYRRIQRGAGLVIPPVDQFADYYLSTEKDPRKAAEKMIARQCTRSTVSGFVTGFGGFMAMPFALPAHITNLLAVQMKMVAATAYMAGYDITSEQVRTLVYACLAGVSVAGTLKKAGIQSGVKADKELVKKIDDKTIDEINQKVGFRLITQFREKGAVHIRKMMPFVGAFIGGGFDLAETSAVGRRAVKMFFDGDFSTGTEVTVPEEETAETVKQEAIEVEGSVE